MPDPLVSVVIPAYNGGDLLGEAIRSVLDQTYRNLELFVVDDASPQDSRGIVAAFDDRRLTFVRHSTNRGAQTARRTGVEASKGDIIFFLDQDDLFHPRKLERHVSFLQAHPEVGLTYNPHFTVLHPPGWVVGIWRPPSPITLEDLILGFPIPPSVWVMRREWTLRDELWDESARLHGAETVICGRLLVAGCRFALVDHALNYRRNHLGRRFADPVSTCRQERRCQDIMIEDPRCPPGIASARDPANVGNYLVFANVAFAQDETETGLSLLEEALRLDPQLAEGDPSPLADFLLTHALLDAADPEEQLRSVFGQIAPRLPAVARELDWAIGEMHLLRAAQHLVWGRPVEAVPHGDRASALGFEADDYAYQRLSYDLLCYELEFGRRAARAALGRVVAGLSRLRGWRPGRLEASYPLAHAFHAHLSGARSDVPGHVLRAFVQFPRCAMNRGAWSILFQAMIPRRAHAGALTPAIGVATDALGDAQRGAPDRADS